MEPMEVEHFKEHILPSPFKEVYYDLFFKRSIEELPSELSSLVLELALETQKQRKILWLQGKGASYEHSKDVKIQQRRILEQLATFNFPDHYTIEDKKKWLLENKFWFGL